MHWTHHSDCAGCRENAAADRDAKAHRQREEHQKQLLKAVDAGTRDSGPIDSGPKPRDEGTRRLLLLMAWGLGLGLVMVFWAYGGFAVAALVGYAYRYMAGRDLFWLRGARTAALAWVGMLAALFLSDLILQDPIESPLILGAGSISMAFMVVGLVQISRGWKSREQSTPTPPAASSAA